MLINTLWESDVYNFIVLGYVPGTHIQITFALWLRIAEVLAVLVILYSIHHAHLIRNWLIAKSFERAIRRQQLA